MRINVAQLLKGPVGGVRKYDVEETIDIYEDGIDRPVSGDVTLIRTGQGVLVQGALETSIDTECSRCLTIFSCPLKLNIEEEYFPTIDIITGTPLSPPEEEPTSFTIDEHHELDLSEAVRQYAIMAIPMKPLCREDCAGLRTMQGRQSESPAESIDPRWYKLLEKVNQEKGTK